MTGENSPTRPLCYFVVAARALAASIPHCLLGVMTILLMGPDSLYHGNHTTPKALHNNTATKIKTALPWQGRFYRHTL